jgi:hypothetical protein
MQYLCQHTPTTTPTLTTPHHTHDTHHAPHTPTLTPLPPGPTLGYITVAYIFDWGTLHFSSRLGLLNWISHVVNAIAGAAALAWVVSQQQGLGWFLAGGGLENGE